MSRLLAGMLALLLTLALAACSQNTPAAAEIPYAQELQAALVDALLAVALDN